MKYLNKTILFLVVFTFLHCMINCNSSEKNNSKSSTSSNNCHCNDLIYDELYNHFLSKNALFLLQVAVMKNMKMEK